MTFKKQRKAKGKEIRKATGIPFVDAMSIGKAIIRKGFYFDDEIAYDMASDFPGVEVQVAEHPCSDGCCSGSASVIVSGKRGTMSIGTFYFS